MGELSDLLNVVGAMGMPPEIVEGGAMKNGSLLYRTNDWTFSPVGPVFCAPVTEAADGHAMAHHRIRI